MTKQIEQLEKIRRIAEENPDLCYSAISEILLGLADYRLGNVEKYENLKKTNFWLF